MAHEDDAIAEAIFKAALEEKKAGELLNCLFDGGSATVDMYSGKLVMISGDFLKQTAKED
jgi:hypothetical protein